MPSGHEQLADAKPGTARRMTVASPIRSRLSSGNAKLASGCPPDERLLSASNAPNPPS